MEVSAMNSSPDGNGPLVAIVAALAAISITLVMAGLINAGSHTPLGVA
jgi:hypothetical protein